MSAGFIRLVFACWRARRMMPSRLPGVVFTKSLPVYQRQDCCNRDCRKPV
jgi:hypothetical protein